MALFSVDVELEGPAGRERVTMLVDTGATYSRRRQAGTAADCRSPHPHQRPGISHVGDHRGGSTVTRRLCARGSASGGGSAAKAPHPGDGLPWHLDPRAAVVSSAQAVLAWAGFAAFAS